MCAEGSREKRYKEKGTSYIHVLIFSYFSSGREQRMVYENNCFIKTANTHPVKGGGFKSF